MNFEYRVPQKEDVSNLWQLMNQLDNETQSMMYEPNERGKLSSSLQPLEKVIARANEKIDFLEVASENDKLVGYLSAERGNPRRIQHSAYLVIGIISGYQGKGIGSKLFYDLDKWARNNAIKRLELTVMQNNVIARHLYAKNGFITEGIRKCSMFVNGQYVNEYYMAKIL
ncbi:hypothetical protein FC19_GL001097 [Liquorilactobacillus aquaticus DSM 21051]|uniref:N-acetyltransferase domain-containing protein n=1 Tax=Liquorilactobacillus aquaticus DSM 21051 TaxID=1423725 RepID=A0A0R2CVZ3_9LACO|nr:GNAT family N-acetyltransferase [Liquorilactobacillus aquaticus]KRM96031.1 hypothetical protein FC19_GL001097 [Liquorilactobacillus aquaticus DSM 21051]